MKEQLTAEQEIIVTAPPPSRIIVTAPAGTGKTHVLIERLALLVNEYRLRPGREVLVLSFSRAAVGVIKQRISTAQDDARYVRAQTFDSFATRLLASYDPLGTWSDQSYDERIRLALGVLSENEHVRDELRSYVHIVVDEIQDLVGVRAEFVRQLLFGAGCGFTLFGDPAQAIFDFQLHSKPNQLTSKALYQSIRREIKDVKEYSLTRNFRAKTEAAKVGLAVEVELRAERPDYRVIRGKLDEIVLSLPTVGPIDSLSRILKSNEVSTAILCRTNGQALLVSRDLFKRGVRHRLQHRATDRCLARWVGTILSGLDAGRIGKSRLEKVVSKSSDADIPDFNTIWRLLKTLDRRQSDDLDIVSVNEKIRRREFPDELNQVTQNHVVVSTIHRAKGLEFDRVVILGPSSGEREIVDQDEFAEQTRLLYVGLTRPRRDLLHMTPPDTRFLALNNDIDRWVLRGFKSWMRNGIEVRSDDTHQADPVGSFLLKCDAALAQEYIRGAVRPGDHVVLERHLVAEQGESKIYYAIKHDGQLVGVTSDIFGSSLLRVLKLNKHWKVSWPQEIHDLYVDDIDTAAGTEASGKKCGLGGSGIWLRVRLCGLGTLLFEKS